MTTMLAKQERDKREKVYAEATVFMKDNPTVTFEEIEDQFGISAATASRLWKDAGYGDRERGRKAGISPLKRQL